MRNTIHNTYPVLPSAFKIKYHPTVKLALRKTSCRYIVHGPFLKHFRRLQQFQEFQIQVCLLLILFFIIFSCYNGIQKSGVCCCHCWRWCYWDGKASFGFIVILERDEEGAATDSLLRILEVDDSFKDVVGVSKDTCKKLAVTSLSSTYWRSISRETQGELGLQLTLRLTSTCKHNKQNSYYTLHLFEYYCTHT